MMEKNLNNHARFTEDCVSPNTPKLVVELQANPELYGPWPYHIRIIIRQAPNQNQPIVFFWCPMVEAFSENGFMLFQHVNGSVKQVEIEPTRTTFKLETEEIDGWNDFLFELWPGTELAFIATLPLKHQNQLLPGETYELYWPGSVIKDWDRGTVTKQLVQYRKPALQTARPTQSLILPAGPSITFRALPEPEPLWHGIPGRVMFGMNLATPQGQLAVAQLPHPQTVPGPTLRASLTTQPYQTLHDPIVISIKITYDGLLNSSLSHAKPIIFHRLGFELDVSRLHGTEWRIEHDPEDETCGFAIYDDPDRIVNISRSDEFVSLRPGESFYMAKLLQTTNWSDLPSDTQVGDRFLVTPKVDGPDWWHWGDQESHCDTQVVLPCFMGATVIRQRGDVDRPALCVSQHRNAAFEIVGLPGQADEEEDMEVRRDEGLFA